MSISNSHYNVNSLSNPRVIGPGSWKALHLLALYSDLNDNDCYSGFIMFFAEKFRCGDCKKHFIDYLRNNPPEKMKSREFGMSIHSWMFHNSVNVRLSKPTISWDEYKAIWIDETQMKPCQKGCGDAAQNDTLSESLYNRIKSTAVSDPSLITITPSNRHIRKK